MKKDGKNKNIIMETAHTKKYTYGDYLNWSDGKRYELLNGQVYVMSPAPSRRHQEVSGEIFRQFANFLVDKKCRVYDAPFDIRLPEGEVNNEEISTVVQPDIVIVCDETKLDKWGCKGAPDLIIEIISPTSASRDRKFKRELYEQHGVKEYWLVDYNEKTVEVYLLKDNNEYGKSSVYIEQDKAPVNIFTELQIDLKLVFRD